MPIDENLKQKTVEFIAREDGTALDSMSGLTWCRYLIGQTWMKRRALGEALLAQTSSVEMVVGYYGGKTARLQFSVKYARLVRG
jgi:hypothetical protein